MALHDVKGLRKAVVAMEGYIPGKTIAEVERELGLSDVIKLGSNENPYAPFPTALRAMTEELRRVHRYPDATFTEIKELLAELHGLDASQVAVSHGAEGMLQNLGKCFLDEGDEVIRSGVTYGLYKEISRLMGARVVEVPVRNWRVDPDAMADAVTAKTKLVWISNPNNPLGSVCEKEAFERLLERLPETAWVILDEAYAEFAPPEELPDRVRLLRERRNLIVVRTFSKYYGLAGARLGYALASADVVTAIDTVSEPFNANRIALAGAVALLRYGKAELEAARQRIFADRERLQRALEERGCFVVPSRANFVFADTPYDGESLAKELLLQGVIVRPCSGWGFSGALRVTVGTTAEVDRFLRTFDEAVSALTERSGATENMEWNVVL